MTRITDERLSRDDTGRVTSDYEPTPTEIEVCRDAICREFGNNGTDGYYIRILKAVHAAASLRAQGGVRVKGLEWEEISPTLWQSEFYTIDASRLSEDSKILLLSPWPTRRFDTEHEAKAAAQADYEQRILSSLEASPAPVSEHPDDLAVDRFAAAMKAKLAKKRAEGRGGWESKDECSAEFLTQLLRKHVEKGDPLDVGNLAMMLHQRGDKIATRDQIGAWVEAEADRNAGLPR